MGGVDGDKVKGLRRDERLGEGDARGRRERLLPALSQSKGSAAGFCRGWVCGFQ